VKARNIPGIDEQCSEGRPDSPPNVETWPDDGVQPRVKINAKAISLVYVRAGSEVAGRPVRPAAIDSHPVRDCDSRDFEALVRRLEKPRTARATRTS
jgi:hypothetical protein